MVFAPLQRVVESVQSQSNRSSSRKASEGREDGNDGGVGVAVKSGLVVAVGGDCENIISVVGRAEAVMVCAVCNTHM